MVSSIAVDAFVVAMFARMANHVAAGSCTMMCLFCVVFGSTDATDGGRMACRGPIAKAPAASALDSMVCRWLPIVNWILDT